MKQRSKHSKRKGAIAVFAAFVLVVFIAIVAVAVDVGYVALARTEAQRTADAAALAAAGTLLEQRGRSSVSGLQIAQAASQFGKQNLVSGTSVALPDHQEELSIGRLTDRKVDVRSDRNDWNAVKVSVNLDGQANARSGLFFARLFDRNDASIRAEATAVFADRIRGFRAVDGYHQSGETISPPLIPFAFPLEDWIQIASGVGPDEYQWDSRRNEFLRGSDGVHEFNLYPHDTGSAGNFGTVDIGSDRTTTPVLRRQIHRGITPDDLAFHGGAIQLDDTGKTFLSADPGVKAAIQHDLQSIIGQTRAIPLYSNLTGTGQDAVYEIRAFGGIRIIEADLTGGAKRVLVQAAPVITRTAIVDDSSPDTSYLIFSPIRLHD